MSEPVLSGAVLEQPSDYAGGRVRDAPAQIERCSARLRLWPWPGSLFCGSAFFRHGHYTGEVLGLVDCHLGQDEPVHGYPAKIEAMDELRVACLERLQRGAQPDDGQRAERALLTPAFLVRRGAGVG